MVLMNEHKQIQRDAKKLLIRHPLANALHWASTVVWMPDPVANERLESWCTI